MKDCLIEARNLIEVNWHKHAYQQGDSHCGVSAINATDAAPHVKLAAVRHLNSIAPGGKLSAYNDQCDTELTDMIDLFNQAIEMIAPDEVPDTFDTRDENEQKVPQMVVQCV